MGKISEIFNFENIGGKIKSFAKWSCWITIALIWVAAPISFIALVINDRTAGFCWIPVVGAIIGPAIVWLSSWGMYAFGQFVEDTHAIRNKYFPVEEERLAKCKAEEKARREAEKQEAKRKAEEEQLSVSDIEEAASAFLQQRVRISDIACTLIYVIPQSTGIPKEMHLDMEVEGREVTSLNLFFDAKRKSYYFKGRQLALDGAWRSAEEIFGFDVSLFKSFHTEVDEDD